MSSQFATTLQPNSNGMSRTVHILRRSSINRHYITTCYARCYVYTIQHQIIIYRQALDEGPEGRRKGGREGERERGREGGKKEREEKGGEVDTTAQQNQCLTLSWNYTIQHIAIGGS